MTAVPLGLGISAMTQALPQTQAKLDQAQKQHIMQLRRGFLGQLQAVIGQRRHIIEELHACVPDCQEGTHGGATTAKVLPDAIACLPCCCCCCTAYGAW